MSSDEQTRDISNLGVVFFSFQRKINFKTVMDLKNSTTEQLLSLLKRRNVPQEALDLRLVKFVETFEWNITANTFDFLKVKLNSGIFSFR